MPPCSTFLSAGLRCCLAGLQRRPSMLPAPTMSFSSTNGSGLHHRRRRRNVEESSPHHRGYLATSSQHHRGFLLAAPTSTVVALEHHRRRCNEDTSSQHHRGSPCRFEPLQLPALGAEAENDGAVEGGWKNQGLGAMMACWATAA